MSAELKSTVATLQAKVAYLETTLAQLMEEKAKKAARRAARATPSLPQSENEGDATDATPSTPTTPSTPKRKKAKKVRDPDAPKKEANAYVKFTIRLGGSKASGEAGLLADNNVSMPPVVQKQFASKLGDGWLASHPELKKVDWVALSDEYTDEYLVEQANQYERPEVSKQSQAKSDAEAASVSGDSESKPKRARGRPKKEKKEAVVEEAE